MRPLASIERLMDCLGNQSSMSPLSFIATYVVITLASSVDDGAFKRVDELPAGLRQDDVIGEHEFRIMRCEKRTSAEVTDSLGFANFSPSLHKFFQPDRPVAVRFLPTIAIRLIRGCCRGYQRTWFMRHAETAGLQPLMEFRRRG